MIIVSIGVCPPPPPPAKIMEFPLPPPLMSQKFGSPPPPPERNNFWYFEIFRTPKTDFFVFRFLKKSLIFQLKEKKKSMKWINKTWFVRMKGYSNIQTKKQMWLRESRKFQGNSKNRALRKMSPPPLPTQRT